MFSVSFLAKALQDAGHLVWVAARPLSELHRQAEKLGLTFLPLTIASKVDRGAMRAIAHWVSTNAIQVINAQSSKDRYVSVFARWFYRLPVAIVHTRRQVSLSVGGPLQNIVYVRGTDRIVAVSFGVKRSLITKGIPSRHIRVIRNGTPGYKFDFSPERVQLLKALYEIKPGEWVVGCIARRKKQHQLVQSLRLIEPPVKLFLVGIEQDEELRSIEIPPRHKVFYPGNLPANEALQFLGLFTCYVLCSTTEGLSQSLLEAMFARVPVITTAAAGNLDLIKHEQNGLLFTDGDTRQLAMAIRRIHTNAEMRTRLIQNARQRVTTYYSMQRVAADYAELFTGLLSSRPKKKDVVPAVRSSVGFNWLRIS